MSALRRWLREERAREAKEQWRADLTVRRAFQDCACLGGPCFRFPCASGYKGDDGKHFFETDEPRWSWSNVPSEPLTAEHLQAVIRDVKGMAGQRMPCPPARPAPLPPRAWELARQEGWIDDDGNLTENYWRYFRELTT